MVEQLCCRMLLSGATLCMQGSFRTVLSVPGVRKPHKDEDDILVAVSV